MKFLFVLLALAALAYSEKTSYSGYKVLRVFPRNHEEGALVHEWENTDAEVDVWGEIREGERTGIDVMITPKSLSKYTRMLKLKNVEYRVVTQDVQDLIENELRSMDNTVDLTGNHGRNIRNIINRYVSFNEILNFVLDIEDNHKDIARTVSIGKTVENRDLRVLILESGNPAEDVWLDFGIHAREWVSPATGVYLIDRLVTEFKAGKQQIVDLFKRYRFHILAHHNPDGYEFSRTTTRLWRKNRQAPPTGSTCLGVDLNRNYDYKWGQGGSSTLPCSETYMGRSVASEPETQAVQNYILDAKYKWASFISVHSYGQWWLTPVGHSVSALEQAPDYPQMLAGARVALDAIKAAHGMDFVAGPSAQLLYVTTGSSSDFAWQKRGVTYSVVIELRPGQGHADASFGFTLPEDRMPMVSRETTDGIFAYWEHIASVTKAPQ